VSSPYVATNGTATFSVSATSTTSNLSSFSFYVSGPGISGNPPLGNIAARNATSCTMSWTPWTAPSQGVYTVTCQVYVTGTPQQTLAATYIATYTVLPPGPHDISLSASLSSDGSSNTYDPNQGVIFTARGIDVGANMWGIAFWVAGPGNPQWTAVANIPTTGSDSTITYNWFPSAPLAPGNYMATIQTYDGSGLDGSVVTYFTVSGSPPFVTGVTASSVLTGQATSLAASVGDVNSDLQSVAFYVSGPGISGSILAGTKSVSGGTGTGTVSYTPPSTGLYTVQAVVTDQAGMTSSATTLFDVFAGAETVQPMVVPNGQSMLVEFAGEIFTTENDTAITTDIQSGSDVVFWSGGRITLKPGFHAENGSFFWAAIDHDMNGYSDIEEAIDANHDGIPDAGQSASNGSAFANLTVGVEGGLEQALGLNPNATFVTDSGSQNTGLAVYTPR